MFKKVSIFFLVVALIGTMLLPAYAAENSVRSDPTLSSSICPNCHVQMTFNGSSEYIVTYERTNLSCPNSDVETGSHTHWLVYNDNYYVCPLCAFSGIMRIFVKERCQISGYYCISTDR